MAASEGNWEYYLGLLREYLEDNRYVPDYAADDNDVELCEWVRKQRQNRATLTEEQRESLECICGWDWQISEEEIPVLIERQVIWDRRYRTVRDYAREVGRLPTISYTTEYGMKIGQWVRRQRKNRAKLSAEQQKMLEELTGWRW